MILSSDPCLVNFGFYKVEVYGLFALISILAFMVTTSFDSNRKKIINLENHLNLLLEITIATILSARLFFIVEEISFFISNPLQIFSIWSGGMSFLGGVCGAIFFLVFRLKTLNINFLRYADLLSTHAPLLHAIARFGCLFSGCCAGAETLASKLNIIYTNPNSYAPIDTPLIPLQLYYSAALLIIFAILFSISRLKNLASGTIFFLYLSLEGSARFINDFFRFEPSPTITIFFNHSISPHQLISLLLASIGILGIITINRQKISKILKI